MSEAVEQLIVSQYSAPAQEYRTLSSKGKRKRGSVEKSQKGALTGKIHVCIKNKAFDVVIGSLNGTLDFRRAIVHASLVFENTLEVVETIKCVPLIYDVTPSKDGTCASVELKLGVLSSQMEGSLFIVQFVFEDPDDPSISFDCLSEPLKTVSKKSQLERGKPKRSRTTQVATREAVLQMIAKMDEQQKDHSNMMHQMFEQNQKQVQLIQKLIGSSPAAAVAPPLDTGKCLPMVLDDDEQQVSSSPAPPAADVKFQQPSKQPPSLEQAFNHLVEAYRRLPANKKNSAVLKLARNTPKDVFADFQECAATMATHDMDLQHMFAESQLLVSPPPMVAETDYQSFYSEFVMDI